MFQLSFPPQLPVKIRHVYARILQPSATVINENQFFDLHVNIRKEQQQTKTKNYFNTAKSGSRVLLNCDRTAIIEAARQNIKTKVSKQRAPKTYERVVYIICMFVCIVNECGCTPAIWKLIST